MSKQELIKVTVVVLLFLLLPDLTRAGSGSEGLTQVIDEYQVELVFPTGQPQTGSNEFAIKLHHPHGQPLADAVVKVTVSRPEPVGALLHQEANEDSPQQVLLSDPHETDTGKHGQAAAPEANEHDEPEHHNAGLENHAQVGSGGHGEMAAPEAGRHDEPEPHNASVDDHDQANSGGHGEMAHGEPAEVALVASPTTGEYTGQVSFSDTGQWLLKVNFMANGEVKETTFVVEAAQNASRWLAINGFLGLNALVILAAAITKRKYVNTKKGKAVA